MEKEEYGDKYNDHLMEEYKVLAQSLNAIGERRVDFNKFYLTLLSGLLAIVSLVIDKGLFSEIHNWIFLFISSFGILLCVLWLISIRSFEEISKSRYRVLHDIEEKLPIPSFSKAWKYMQEDGKYMVIAKINLYVPFLMIGLYVLLGAFALYNMLCR